MKIIAVITLLELAILTLWLLLLHYRKSVKPSTRTALDKSLPIAAATIAAPAPQQPEDVARWAFINQRSLEPAASDRRPMNEAVSAVGSSRSARRSFARRSHQLNYKKWSRERHD